MNKDRCRIANAYIQRIKTVSSYLELEVRMH